MSWPKEVPILTDKDISLSPSMHGSPNTLGMYLIRTFPVSKMMRVQGAIASAHHALLNVIPSKARTALVFNVAMAYLGYTEGQDDEVKQIAFSIKFTLTYRETLQACHSVINSTEGHTRRCQLRKRTTAPSQ